MTVHDYLQMRCLSLFGTEFACIHSIALAAKEYENMTNAEKYTYWRTNYERMEKRYLEGNISADELDRLDLNMLERLGMDKWTQKEWQWEHAGYDI